MIALFSSVDSGRGCRRSVRLNEEAGGSDRGSPRLNTEQLAQLLAVGPTQDLLAGSTKIRIELGESHLSEYEHADTQATIVISFDRAQDCTHDAPGGLLGNASIALTVEEWRALSEQLNGPLKVLLERKPYSTDLG